MITMIRNILRRRKRKPFLERTYKDMPGFSVPSVEDLRLQVLLFEKRIKDYIQRKHGKLPAKVTLHQLIHDILANYPLYPQFKENWPKFVEEAKSLKEFRNNIVHSDFNDLPPVAELYERFKKANKTLLPFGICSGERDKFKPIAWHGNSLEIIIDGNTYILSPSDIINLQIELNPSNRGKVQFIKGRLVEGKMLDYNYEKVTYFIEGFPEFELTHDESMVLGDLLSSLIGKYAYSTKIPNKSLEKDAP